MTIYHELFPSLVIDDHDDVEYLQRAIRSGRSTPILKYGMNLNLYRKGDILESPWGKLLEVDEFETYTNKSNLNKLPSNILNLNLLDKLKLRDRTIKFDIIYLKNICALVFFFPTLRYYEHRYKFTHCGLIYNGKIYESWDILKTRILDFQSNISYLAKNKPTFVTTQLDRHTLQREINIGCHPIEFISRVINLTNRKIFDTTEHLSDRKFSDYNELYEHLKRRQFNHYPDPRDRG